MDPSEDFPPPPALFPPPAPAAAAPPPASTAASLVGPRIFVLSPLPGNKYEVDRYFYSARADVTTGDYAALLALATHYAYPLAILQCPDLAAFQASNPAAVVRPFDEVPAPIIERGRALMLSSAASVASPSGGSASSQSLLSLSTSLPSAGANAHRSSSVRGHDPPSVAAANRTSSLPVSHTFAPPFPPRRPDPDGVDGPSSVFGMGGSGGFGRLGGPPGGLGVWAIVVPPPALPPSPVSRATPPPTMTFGHTTSLAQSRKRFLLSYSIVMGFLMGFLLLLVFLFLLRLWDIIMALHLWHLRLRSLLRRGVLCPMTISLSLLLRN